MAQRKIEDAVKEAAEWFATKTFAGEDEAIVELACYVYYAADPGDNYPTWEDLAREVPTIANKARHRMEAALTAVAGWLESFDEEGEEDAD